MQLVLPLLFGLLHVWNPTSTILPLVTTNNQIALIAPGEVREVDGDPATWTGLQVWSEVDGEKYFAVQRVREWTVLVQPKRTGIAIINPTGGALDITFTFVNRGNGNVRLLSGKMAPARWLVFVDDLLMGATDGTLTIAASGDIGVVAAICNTRCVPGIALAK